MKIKVTKMIKQKDFFPRKAKIILVFEDGVIIHGDGVVDGRKYHGHKQAIFTATLLKNI